MTDSDGLTQIPRPTATRPLLGMTVLVVEDSRFACDAMRLLCLRSGARIRRADCLQSARRHLALYRPTVTIIDLGLPDGSGAELIAEVSTSLPRVAVVLGTSGDSFAEDVAYAAGADGFFPKPVENLATFQNTIISLLTRGTSITKVKLSVTADRTFYTKRLASRITNLTPLPRLGIQKWRVENHFSLQNMEERTG